MEHSCHKCNAIVEDGTAFCPNCNAPQIRVMGFEPPVPPETGDALDAMQPLASGTMPGSIQWSQALPSAALAGLIIAIAMLLPLGAFGLEMVVAGALAVLFYRRKNRFSEITPGIGARIGAVSGLLGFGILLVFTMIGVVFFHSGTQIRQALEAAVQQAAARSSDPQAQQAMEFLKSPQGLAVVITFGLIFMLLIFLALSSLGGALGAVLLKRKDQGKP